MLDGYFHLTGFDYLDPLFSRPSPPLRVEGHIAFQPQSAVIQCDGDES